jgi:hypothetical protein
VHSLGAHSREGKRMLPAVVGRIAMDEFKMNIGARWIFSRTPMARKTDSLISFWALFILALGMLLNLVGYGSFQPVLIGALFLLIFMLLLSFKGFGGSEERQAYLLVYSVGWFWAGVAVAFVAFANDYSQVGVTDGDHFFNLASSGKLSGATIEHIVGISEGAGVIVIWGYLYDFFCAMGLEKGRYIGVTLNVTLVSLSAVVGVKIMRSVFGKDQVRIQRFTLVFALCGIFWLYAALHLRDAAVLFAVSLLIYFWIRYLNDFSAGNLLILGGASLTAFLYFRLLRTEFTYVPVAMFMAAIAAAAFGSKINGVCANLVLLAGMFALSIAGYLLITMGMESEFIRSLIINNDYYRESALMESNEGSLAYKLILNQPFPIRLVAGSMYIFIFPVPFWIGFQMESVYHLLKSFHALFMYAMTPLFALAVSRVIASKTLRSMPILFLLFITTGFTISIVFTSLETRHLGTFLPALLVIAMLPNLTAIRDRLAYRNLLALFLGAMFLVHSAWFVLKSL